MKALILVGGLGTRMRSVLGDMPKPMAPVKGKPFIAWVLAWLKTQGFTDIFFSTHYQSEKIKAYFGFNYLDFRIQYIHEEQPLGTGGAIVRAFSCIDDKTSPVFVLNGDTFLKMNYSAMAAQHQSHSFGMALKHVNDCSRYGKVVMQDNKVCAFHEKGAHGPGLINAGVYLLRPDFFSSFDVQPVFSLEHEFLAKHAKDIAPQAFITQDYFVDIGMPCDYEKVQTEFQIPAE